MKKNLWGICYGLTLVAFTIYVLLDTFVITRVYETVQSDYNTRACFKNKNCTKYMFYLPFSC